MHLRTRHLITATGVAALVHLAGVALFWQTPTSGAQSAGRGGLQVGLGPAGGAPGSTARAVDAPTETAEAAPPPPATAETETQTRAAEAAAPQTSEPVDPMQTAPDALPEAAPEPAPERARPVQVPAAEAAKEVPDADKVNGPQVAAREVAAPEIAATEQPSVAPSADGQPPEAEQVPVAEARPLEPAATSPAQQVEQTATVRPAEPDSEVRPDRAEAIEPEPAESAEPTATQSARAPAEPAPAPAGKPEPPTDSPKPPPEPSAKPTPPKPTTMADAEPYQTQQRQPANTSDGQDTDKQASVSGAGGKSGSGQEAAAGSGKSSSGGGSPGAHPDYFTKLRAWLEKHKQYPRRARLRRLEGTATLRFVMDRGGRVLSFELTSSSGHDMLDNEVRDMIQRAQPLPSLPDTMDRERVELEIPVRFALR